jgi:hypothetical protein
MHQGGATYAERSGHWWCVATVDIPISGMTLNSALPNQEQEGSGGNTALMGLARLMTLAFHGVELAPLAQKMIERARVHEHDGNALMDLAVILQLQGAKEIGLAALDQALQTQRIYRLPSRRSTTLRLLAIMAHGDLMANAPLPFLFEDADIELTMLYLRDGEPLSAELPPHDLITVAVSESRANRELLQELAQALTMGRSPVFNRPERILMTARDAACKLIQDVPGIHMPSTHTVSRAELQWLVAGHCALADMLLHGDFPLIIRPLDSHAGHGLEKVESAPDLAAYLAGATANEFFISPFVDYKSPDGLYRKYRVVLVDGVPFPAHMGVSAHWMIHYLNAGMSESAEKRAEEDQFMRGFDTGFAQLHGASLKALSDHFGLEYLVIDCAETSDGKLLVFEVDPGAVVHSMDPPELFPYKAAHMQKVFKAFRAMLQRVIARGN